MPDFAEGHRDVCCLSNQVVNWIVEWDDVVQLDGNIRLPLRQLHDFIVLGAGEFAFFIAVLHMRQVDDALVVATLQVIMEGEGGDTDRTGFFKDVEEVLGIVEYKRGTCLMERQSYLQPYFIVGGIANAKGDEPFASCIIAAGPYVHP